MSTFCRLQIVAVILCDTGIALLAYMEGITGSSKLGGVVMAAVAAAGSAVYKVPRAWVCTRLARTGSLASTLKEAAFLTILPQNDVLRQKVLTNQSYICDIVMNVLLCV
jgi:threonine/homoserine efflux transporter RhtA